MPWKRFALKGLKNSEDKNWSVYLPFESYLDKREVLGMPRKS